MKWLFFLFAVLLVIPVKGQKRLYKKWDAESIKTLVIRSDEVYSIRLLSGDFDAVTLYTYIEGETSESVVVETKLSNDSLYLRSAYSPYFTPHNDKLAAHKVVAIEMEITLPRELEVDVEAAIASFGSRGPISKLKVSLDNGNCDLEDFMGRAVLMTRKGAITVKARPGATALASSRFGMVSNLLEATTEPMIVAESYSGDILLEVSQ